jgi:signal transduction histidine kinase
VTNSETDEDVSRRPAVLAVDDYPVNLLALSAIVETLPIRLVTATSGGEAIARAQEQEFGAILLDVMMPEMDGFETLKRLRAIPSCHDTPVVLLTAYELEVGAIAQLEGMGMVDYILKPIAPIILRSKISAVISLHQRGEALAAKDRHIAMLAHDLQTPLTAIGVSADVLAQADLDPRSRAASERILRGVDRMTEMIRNLTDQARAGQGPFPVTPQRMDVGNLCREILDEFREPESSRIDLEVMGDLAGEWDKSRLYQAVANLVTNAIRYGEGKVILRASPVDGDVEISVQNGGPAIPQNLLAVIFKPFERGAADRSGLGLGLYIVREIVKAHRGTVGVTSTATDGTTFVLRLPRSLRKTTTP